MLKNIFAILMACLITLFSTLRADVHFTLKGTLSDSNYNLQNQANRSAAASIATDVGNYIRLGLTHREEVSAAKGFSETERGSRIYYYFSTRSREIANSIDLTLILYYGELLVPYVQVGMVQKTNSVAYGNLKIGPVVSDPMPSGGVGLGIRLNRNFSLKLDYTVSPGSKKRDPFSSEKAEGVLDSYSSLGITYNI